MKSIFVIKEGLIFILPTLLLGVAATLFSLWPLAIGLFLLACFFIFFFRDPERPIIAKPNSLLSPADGRIIDLKKENGTYWVTIFLSLLDVHIVRSPVEGIIQSIENKEGKKIPAMKPKAANLNQAKILTIQNQNLKINLKMIVGIAARRIFCFVKPGDKVMAGTKIGLMAFGSRVEMSIPEDFQLKISLNQKVKAGITLLAEKKDQKLALARREDE